jgi:hypothetical protein
MKPSHTALLLAVICLAWNAVAADTWRCGNVYTDQPCPNGRRLGIGDDHDPARKRDADTATRDAQSTADRMEADRRRLEAMGARNRPVVIGETPRQEAKEPTAAKPRKGQKETLYASPRDASKKKSKTAGKEKTGE